MGLQTVVAEFNPDKPSLFVAKLSKDRDDLRSCGSLGQRRTKRFLVPFGREKSLKVPVLEATSFQSWHVSIKFHEFVNQKGRQKDFFLNFGIPAPQKPDTSL